MLLDTAREVGVRRFLFISSIAAAFRDQRRYPYAQSKRQAEQLVEGCGLDYLIVRPTILLGPAAPVIVSLSKLAAGPIVPMPGDGTARVQPVSAADLASCLLNTIEHGGFGNRIVEIGGPESMTIEELLLKIRRVRYGKPARVLHLPAAPIAAVLGFFEKLLLPVLPVTAGQVATFTNDGTAHNSSDLAGHCVATHTVDDMLRAL
jgi:NADH dehydrogenase